MQQDAACLLGAPEFVQTKRGVDEADRLVGLDRAQAPARRQAGFPPSRVQRHAHAKLEHIGSPAVRGGQSVELGERVARHAQLQVALGREQDPFGGHPRKGTTNPRRGAILHPCQF